MSGGVLKTSLALAIFVLNVVLNWPLFLPGESVYRDSIEAGYQGMSRFIASNPSIWGWNPLQYCGQPTQFTYLPFLHYATALIALVTGAPPEHAYKIVTATLACLGPVAVFWLVAYFSRSNWWAMAAAVGFTLFSPVYGLITQMDKDRGVVTLPWRMHVFAKYGEGPHVSGVTLLMGAMLAAFATATGRKFWHVPVTAMLFAAVCLTNWVAALALAITCLLMMLAAFRLQWRLIGALVLAYGLACFWLTPTFIRTVAFNWPVDAFNYKLQAAQNWLLAGWVAGTLALRLLQWALRWPFYISFTTLGLYGFGYPVLIYYSWNIDTIPESRRYALEFSVFLLLTLVEFIRWGVTSSNRVRQVCAASVTLILLFAGAPAATKYLTQGYEKWRPIPRETTDEHRIAKWIADRRTDGRILVTGSLRFRVNKWFDLHQVGGTFESGLRNRVPVNFAYQIRTGIGSRPDEEAQEAILQMKAVGAEYVVVHGPGSKEHYRDYTNPMKFEGVLEKVFADDNDWVYRVPFRSLAHLVKPEEQPEYAHRRWLKPYVAAIDDVARPTLRFRWLSPRQIEVEGPVPAGHDVVLAVTQEAGWQATQDGAAIPMDSNTMNFIVAKARPSAHSVFRFEYKGTPEQRGMAVLSVSVWTGMFVFLWRRWKIAYR